MKEIIFNDFWGFFFFSLLGGIDAEDQGTSAASQGQSLPGQWGRSPQEMALWRRCEFLFLLLCHSYISLLFLFSLIRYLKTMKNAFAHREINTVCSRLFAFLCVWILHLSWTAQFQYLPIEKMISVSLICRSNVHTSMSSHLTASSCGPGTPTSTGRWPSWTRTPKILTKVTT